MEIIVTIAYFFLVRLIFFDYKLLRFTLFWKFIVFGLYAAAALTEVILLGQYGPYSKEAAVEAYVVQMAPEFGGIVKAVYAEANKPMKKGDPLFEMDGAQWEERLLQAQRVNLGDEMAPGAAVRHSVSLRNTFLHGPGDQLPPPTYSSP